MLQRKPVWVLTRNPGLPDGYNPRDVQYRGGERATIVHAGDSSCYVIDIKGNVKYGTIDHIESSSLSLSYINRAFFTRHPEDAVPDVKTLKLQPLDCILLDAMRREGYIVEEAVGYTNMAESFDQVLRGFKRKRSRQGRYLLAHREEVIQELTGADCHRNVHRKRL